MTAPVFSKGRDLDVAAEAIGRWLGASVTDLTYPSGAGVSNETILFTADGEELVLRVAPSLDYQLFEQPRFRMQFDLLEVLGRLGTVRVPQVLRFEEDPGVLGAPFFVMARLRGRVPVSMPLYTSTGWVVEATTDERRRLWRSAMEQLAAIHLVPVEEVAFVGAADQLGLWWSQAEWVFGEVPEPFTSLFAWLRANEPDETPGLSWGDARVGNVMFTDGFEVAGVMDWEQASLAGGMADLGWWLFFDHVHSVEAGVERPSGLGTRDETIELYESLTGRAVAHVEWHEAFAGVKTALLAQRTRQVRNIESMGGPQDNPYLRIVSRITGVPV